jgi:hypothetical protein
MNYYMALNVYQLMKGEGVGGVRRKYFHSVPAHGKHQ